MHRSWRLRAGIVILLVGALALRLARLDEANLWWDEALAVWAVRKSLVGTTLWTAADVHPPVFFWLLWGWTRLVGEAEFPVRYLSTLLGVSAVALVFVVGRRIGGPTGGFAAAALTAVAPFMVWWSMELRMYMTAGAFLLLACYGAIRWLEFRDSDSGSAPPPKRQGTRWSAPVEHLRGLRSIAAVVSPGTGWLIAYVAAAAAATHTIYLAAAGIAAINLGAVAWLAAGRDRRRLRTWIVAQVVVAAAHIPWLALALPRMSSWRSVGQPASVAFVVRLWATLLATGVSADLDQAAVLTGVFVMLAGAVVALASRRRRADRGPGGVRKPQQGSAAVLICGAFLFVPPLAVWAATQPRSIFYTPAVEARYLAPFAGPVYALLGGCLGRLAGRAKVAANGLAPAPGGRAGFSAAVLGLGLLAVPASALPRYYAGRQWTDRYVAMSQAVWTQAEPGDVVLLVSGSRYPVIEYVYDRRPPPGGTRPDSGWMDGSGTALTDANRLSMAVDESDTVFSGQELRVTRAAFFGPADRPPLVPFPDEGGGHLDQQPWRERIGIVDGQYRRIWLMEVDRQLQDPDGQVRARLAETRPLLLSEAYGADSLHLFGAPATDATVLVRRLAGPREPAPEGAPAASVALPARRLGPGTEADVVWFETRPGEVAADYAALVRPADGLVLAMAHAETPQGGVPPRRYRAEFAADNRLPSGTWEVALGRGSGVWPVGALEVTGTSHIAPGAPVRAGLGWVELQAAGMTQKVRPAGTVTLDLVWRLTGRPPAEEPVVFAHLLGPARPDGGIVWAVGDGPPSWGSWLVGPPGSRLDRHLLEVPDDAPPGTYTIEVGLYDPVSGDRVEVHGPDADATADRIVVGTVTVSGS